MDADRLRTWIALATVPGLTALRAHKLLEAFGGNIDAIFKASPQELLRCGLSKKLIGSINRKNSIATIDQMLDWEHQEHHAIICFDSVHYPENLKQTADPPLLLYCIGDVALLQAKQVAMVGSRTPTPAGKNIAHHWSAELAYGGVVITSGLAYGIDAASHRGALSTSGKTIAVLGSGLRCIYPKEHVALYKDVCHHGLVVSEFPLDTPPRPHNFPRRNRIISGLSLGVVVVEAAIGSGSLITARFALEQNRNVMAVPSTITNNMAHGCHQLIKEGAYLVESPADICAIVGFSPKVSHRHCDDIDAKQSFDFSVEEKRILAELGEQILTTDMIVERTQLPPQQVAAVLVGLELHGAVVSLSGDRYQSMVRVQ